MSTTPNLTPLLLWVRNAGLTLWTYTGDLIVSPRSRLASKLLDDIKRHKAELLKYLSWDEDTAHALLKDAIAHIAEFHLRAGKPEFDVAAHWAYRGRIDEAFAAKDMFALRIAVRDYVQDARASFRAH